MNRWSLSKKHLLEIRGMSTKGLVAFHNILVMSLKSIMCREDRQVCQTKLNAVNKEIKSRNVLRHNADPTNDKLINSYYEA